VLSWASKGSRVAPAWEIAMSALGTPSTVIHAPRLTLGMVVQCLKNGESVIGISGPDGRVNGAT
jgi:hypothetical protein